jgi:hypothetical protein
MLLASAAIMETLYVPERFERLKDLPPRPAIAAAM